jgi:hypothetical protein
MNLRDIDDLKKYNLSQSNPTQNHYRYKYIREDDRGQKYLIITDTNSVDDSWKIPLTKKLEIEIAQVKPGEWFYIKYIPSKTFFRHLDSNHLYVQQDLGNKRDISSESTDCEVDLDDLEKEYVFSDFPVFPDNIE